MNTRGGYSMTIINGRNLAAFKDRIEIGDKLRCMDNSYIPSREGGILTVTDKTTNTLTGIFEHDEDEYPFGMFVRYGVHWPTRVVDVVDLSRDQITYRIGKGQHTATWKVQP